MDVHHSFTHRFYNIIPTLEYLNNKNMVSLWSLVSFKSVKEPDLYYLLCHGVMTIYWRGLLVIVRWCSLCHVFPSGSRMIVVTVAGRWNITHWRCRNNCWCHWQEIHLPRANGKFHNKNIGNFKSHHLCFPIEQRIIESIIHSHGVCTFKNNSLQ